MPNGVVVGVYLERHGGVVMRAEASGLDIGRKTITPTHTNRFDWSPQDVEKAKSTVREIAKTAAQMGGSDLKSIAIACYGPFLSLRRSNISETFGVLHPMASNLPLRGVNLLDVFYDEIVKNGANRDAYITIHTDAEACAIGEAMNREMEDKKLLAFLLVTEGIGLGIVQGQRPLSSALHSEIGMLHVRYKGSDKLKPDKDSNEYARSLSEMADNNSLRKRLDLMYKKTSLTNEEIARVSNRDIWELRAYYLAQACLACTVILPPNQIILGADIDFKSTIAERTSRYFREFLDERKIDGQPVFSFDELSRPDYIDVMQSIPDLTEPTSLRTKGVLGMCYAAATTEYGAVHRAEFRR